MTESLGIILNLEQADVFQQIVSNEINVKLDCFKHMKKMHVPYIKAKLDCKNGKIVC